MIPSMRPQPFCSLPWCGHAPGGSNKVRIVDGERLEYPEGIDAHHVFGKHEGPVAYICHECHMKHHDGRRRLKFIEMNGHLVVLGPCRWQPLRTANEFDCIA